MTMGKVLRGRSRRAPAIGVLLSIVLVLGAGLLPAAAANPGSGSDRGKEARSVDVQILSFNDFHGNLEPPVGSSGRITTPTGPVDAGGVEYLATHIHQLEATNPNTVVVAPGDIIGASPLISALFHDEPTIEAMNALGLDIASVGNHEFDEGAAELLRMQNGGCHPIDGCQDGDGFAGADFQYLSANVIVDETGQTLLPAYEVRKFKGAKVAFIGVTLEGTPSIVTPAGVAGLTFKDEADTVNALIPQLQKKGIEAFVVLLHEGAFQSLPPGYINDCDGISGPVVDIVNRFDPAVDVVLSGHTHQAYNCLIDGKLVTSAGSFGRLVTDVDIRIDRATKDVTRMAAANLIVTRDVPRDPAESAIVAKYAALTDVLRNTVVGSITGDIVRAINAAGESPLGDVIADAQLEATSSDARIAFMNPGGIRADLVCGPGETAPCPVTFGELFSVQPFGNDLVKLTLTGAQIDTLLEQQFDNPSPGGSRILQVSSGFSYTWSASAPTGSKVDPASITLNGVPISPTGTYRVTVNSFLASGGDNFTVLRDGTDRVVSIVDVDALVAYFRKHSPVGPGSADRIRRVP